jgi:uncharacterized protein YbjT (DUF2867 family)
MDTIFITGGTGFLGSRFISLLLNNKQYQIHALVRSGSENKLPQGVIPIIANPFDAETFKNVVPKNCIYVHLIGVKHPAPWKVKEFREIDYKSVEQSIIAAKYANAIHFIYVSVTHEPSVMWTYQNNKKATEKILQESDINLTFIRPWYVLGPNRTWPKMFDGLYQLAERFPNALAKIRKFRLTSIDQMMKTLLKAVDSRPIKLKVYEIEDMTNRNPFHQKREELAYFSRNDHSSHSSK